MNTSTVKLDLNGTVFDMISFVQINATTYIFTRNITGLSDGNRSYFFTAKDVADNIGISDTFNVAVDTTAPLINFISPTPPNGTFFNTSLNGTSFTAALNITELSIKNITFTYRTIQNDVIISSDTVLVDTVTKTHNQTVVNSTKNTYEACIRDQFDRIACTENRTIFILPNVAPVLSTNISDQSAFKNDNITGITLTDHFTDPEGWGLVFAERNGGNITVIIASSSNVTIVPDTNFVGTTWIIFNATDDQGLFVDSNNFTVTFKDPFLVFENITETKDPVTFEEKFNITIDVTSEAGTVDTVLIETNDTGTFTNFTMALLSGNTFFKQFNASQFGVGNITYRFHMNNSFGNLNTSTFSGLEINQHPTVITMTLNGVANNLTISVSTSVTTIASSNCVSCPSDLILVNQSGTILQQGATIDFTETINISVGANITYTVNMTGNENYTTDTKELIVFFVANAPPVWITITNQSIKRGHTETLNLTPFVSDPENDTLIFSVLTDLPLRVDCSVDSSSGILTLVADIENNQTFFGNTSCVVAANDTTLITNATVNIEVNNTGFVIIGIHEPDQALSWNITTLTRKDINLSCRSFDTFDFSAGWFYE